MKVKEIIPIIDDIIGIYNKNRNIILAFGETDVEKIAGLVNSLKRFLKK